jgi:hypothetical protein
MYKIIGADLKEYGPVSVEQLRQWVAEGRVNGLTKIQAAGTTEWKRLSEFPEFPDVLPRATLPPVPPPAPSSASSAAPITPLRAPPSNSKLAIWSMVTGILSLLCCCGWYVLAPVAIVLGAVALSQLKRQPELTGRGFAIAGIVLGVLALIVYVPTYLFLYFNPDFMQSIQSQLH